MRGEDEFTFWHILVRDVAYAQIPRSQRAARHRKAAEWIERAAGERVGDHADILAHHYLQAVELDAEVDAAGRVEMQASASRYLHLAGHRANQLDKPRAEALYRHALALVPRGTLEEAEIRTSLGASMFSAGADTSEETAMFEAAEAIFERHGQVVRAAYAKTLRALALRQRNQMELSRTLLAEARETLEGQPPGVELVRVYSGLGGDAMLRSRYQESREFAQKAIDLAEQLGRPELGLRALQYRGWARWDARDPEGAKADLKSSVELGVQHGEATETAIAYNNYAGLRWVSEGPAAGLETYEEGMAFSVRRGMRGTRLWSLAESTICLYDLGRWDEVLSVAGEVAAESLARSWSQVEALANPQRGKVMHWRGDRDGARLLAAGNMPIAREVGDPQLLIPALELQGILELADGRMAEAREAILEIERITVDTTPLIFSGAADLVRTACAAGDLALAGRLVENNLAIPGRTENIMLSGRATIAEADGRPGEAAPLYLDMASRWAEYGSVIDQAQALLGAGRCLYAVGRGADAVEPLRAARAIFASLGATVLVDQTDDQLAQSTARAG
jgi:tetratricopeptide (TPR) repeat protein